MDLRVQTFADVAPARRHEAAATSGAEVLRTSAAIYFPLLLVATLAFEWLRRTRPEIWDPENHFASMPPPETTTRGPHNRRTSFVSWVPFLFGVSDRAIVQRCGLDAWVFLRFIRVGEKVAALAVLCSFGLFPLYASSPVPYALDPWSTPLPTTMDDDMAAGHGHRLDAFDRLSIANVEAGNWRLWLALATAYALSAFVLRLLRDEYAAFMRCRHEFLARKDAQQYSVVVTDLPRRLRRPQPLLTYMDYLFPGCIQAVYVGVECRGLEELLARREQIQYRLDAALAELHTAPEAATATTALTHVHRPRLVLRRRYCFGLCGPGTEVDAIEHYGQELETIDRAIATEREAICSRQLDVATADKPHGYGSIAAGPPPRPPQSEGEDTRAARLRKTIFSTASDSETLALCALPGDDHEARANNASLDLRSSSKALVDIAQRLVDRVTGFALNTDSAVMRNAAFVSFRSLRAAHSAQQLLQTENPIRLRIQAAPHIRDVVWENFGLPHQLKSTWALVATLLTVAVVCFWTVPTAFVTSLANVQKLRRTLPVLDQIIQSYPWAQRSLEQLAPLLFSSMNALAYVIFRLLATREGHLSMAEVDASVFTKLCYFQVFQMFFVSAVTGSIITQMMALVDQPKRVFFFLGSSIASQSMLFITFTIVQCCVTLPLFLLRVIPILKDALHRLLAPAYAQRPARQPWMGLCPLGYYPDLDPAYSLAQQFLVFLLVVVFAPIAPMVGYVGLLFFLCSEVVYRRFYFFVSDRAMARINSTGVFWPPLFNFTIGALGIAQCTLIGLLSLKTANVLQLLAAVALPLGTCLFYWYIVTVCGYAKASLNLPLDQCCALDEDRKDEAFDFLDGIYQQPAMARAHALPIGLARRSDC